MKAHLVFTGTELLLGQIVNTNAQYLGKKLAEMGIDVFRQVTVGDNLNRIAEAMTEAKDADLIVVNGGLGPTEDDLSREALSKALGIELVESEEALAIAERFFKMRKMKIASSNQKQGLVPQGGIVLDNQAGTAPGIILNDGEKHYVLLPGPPYEMQPMFEKEVMPYLQKKLGLKEVIKSKILKISGIGEALAEEKLKDLLDSNNPTLAPTAKIGEVHFRITAKAESENQAQELIAKLEQTIRERLGEYIYGTDEEILEEVVGRILTERNLSLATAESCTGGLLGNRLTNIEGSSSYFLLGGITYSNEAKEKLLGVKRETLEQFGAVSKETAGEMAAGIRNYAGSDIGIGITGIAGPGGGSPEKPVGLVYFGLAYQGKVTTYRENFIGSRETIKAQAAQRALRMLWEALKENHDQ